MARPCGEASMNLRGMNVFESPLCADVPRMTPSKRFSELMPHAYVEELREWMRAFFGTTDMAFMFSDPMTGKPMVAVSPRMMTEIKAQRTCLGKREGGEERA